MSHFFTSGGLSIGASASDLPMNIQDWSHPQILLPLKRMREGINSSALSFPYNPALISMPHTSDMERCMSMSVIAWPAPGLFPVSLVYPSVPESHCVMPVALYEPLVFLRTFLAFLEFFFPDEFCIHVVKLKNVKEFF